MNEIQFPALPNAIIWKNTFESFDKMIETAILYLCYGIAILCGFKIIIYILNGFATKSYMGSRTMDDSSFGG
jgi:hypothetical protein